MTAPDRPTAPETGVEALAGQTPPNKHGQLCPVWTRRTKRAPRIGDCDCWVLSNARSALSRLAADGWILRREEVPVPCPDCPHGSCGGGCH